MTKAQASELLARHALSTLPDSLRARTDLLEATRITLPRGNDLRTYANLQLGHLEAMEQTQIQFDLQMGGKP